MKNNKRRSGFSIMAKLIKIVFPLTHIMLVAIIFGVIGYLCAIFLSIFASNMLLDIYSKNLDNLKILALIMIIIAVLRGVFHYIEHYCNHLIAFKILALIRHNVFEKLRKLCPAKLECKNKGDLISLITTDIELLEVFYAHTISPIAIAILCSLTMLIYIGKINIYLALIALFAYICVGIIIPVINSKLSANDGLVFRKKFADLNVNILDSLNGIDEVLQFNSQNKQVQIIDDKSQTLINSTQKLNRHEKRQRTLSLIGVFGFSLAIFITALKLYTLEKIDIYGFILSFVAMSSSFGPVLALSQLSNNLNQTLASGDRLLDLLEEKPEVEEISGMDVIDDFHSMLAKNISFSYDKKQIINDLNFEIKDKEIIGLYGESGCGKSTLAKLLMRFWLIKSGNIFMNDKNINDIPSNNLKKMQSYIGQDAFLFNDTIRNNIILSNPTASEEEIINAAKKASIHDTIIKFSDGYDTYLGEGGQGLSGGEKQRIALARAFLHNSNLMILDEPTSNLDSLNEGMILKAIDESKSEKSILIISHKPSTLNICKKKLDFNSLNKK